MNTKLGAFHLTTKTEILVVMKIDTHVFLGFPMENAREQVELSKESLFFLFNLPVFTRFHYFQAIHGRICTATLNFGNRRELTE